MSWSLNEPLLLLQICFELKKNKEISNFFLPHSSSWHRRFTYDVDRRWSSAVGSWLQHLNWWWWASKASSSQSVASDAAYRMNTSASVWIWLPNLLKNKSSGNGASPISTQIWACFQCLFFSYSQTLITFLSFIRGGSIRTGERRKGSEVHQARGWESWDQTLVLGSHFCATSSTTLSSSF